MVYETLSGYLYEHIFAVSEELTNDLDFLIEDNVDYYTQAEIMQSEAFLFASNTLYLKLKHNDYNTLKKYANKFVDIMDMSLIHFTNFLRDVDQEQFIDDIIDINSKRMEDYEDNFNNDESKLCQIFFNIISSEFETLSIFKNNIKKIENNTMDLKLHLIFGKFIRNIEIIISLFFKNSINTYVELEKKGNYENFNKIYSQYIDKYMDDFKV
jgi:hypothetical protein